LDSTDSEWWRVAGSCEHGTEYSGSVQGEEYLEYMTEELRYT